MKYKKKPEYIEAICWTGKNLDEMSSFLGDCLGPIERRPDYKLKVKSKNNPTYFWVEMDKGDYVTKDKDGLFHVTSERWLNKDYEKVE